MDVGDRTRTRRFLRRRTNEYVRGAMDRSALDAVQLLARVRMITFVSTVFAFAV